MAFSGQPSEAGMTYDFHLEGTEEVNNLDKLNRASWKQIGTPPREFDSALRL